jgi:hypothetical protein
VKLTTFHSAKGLEFDTVILADVTEGIVAPQRADGDGDEIDVERRLLYVAMTRARHDLYLIHRDPPSRFMQEMDPELSQRMVASTERKAGEAETLEPTNVNWWGRLARQWTNRAYGRGTAFLVNRTAEELRGWLENIALSEEQLAVVLRDEPQMLINGSAGTGKSLTLLYRLLNALDHEEPGGRFLYVSYNLTLIQDAYKRLQASEKFAELRGKHDVDVHTFHSAAVQLLEQIGVRLPPFVASQQASAKLRNTQMTHALVFCENFLESPEYLSLPPAQ